MWSLGATVWELAQAEPPFSNTTDPGQMADRWPPLLQPEIYSRSFHDFLHLCSQPSSSRPTPDELLKVSATLRDSVFRQLIPVSLRRHSFEVRADAPLSFSYWQSADQSKNDCLDGRVLTRMGPSRYHSLYPRYPFASLIGHSCALLYNVSTVLRMHAAMFGAAVPLGTVYDRVAVSTLKGRYRSTHATDAGSQPMCPSLYKMRGEGLIGQLSSSVFPTALQWRRKIIERSHVMRMWLKLRTPQSHVVDTVLTQEIPSVWGLTADERILTRCASTTFQ